MDVIKYFESLSLELQALKDRVRFMIQGEHWLTDGEWKESVLRSTLRRHLPNSVEVASGFLVAPDDASKQIDVLVYDSSKPVLFKDADLVFLTSDAARAIIEVKSKIHSSSHLSKVLNKLADKAEFIYEQTPGNQFDAHPPFVGLFAYEWSNCNDESVLAALHQAATTDGNRNPHTRIVNHVALGPNCFVRYWKTDPYRDRGANYCRWHSYKLPDRAYGYFIHNVIDSVSNRAVEVNPTLWFPESGKEIHRTGTRSMYGSHDNDA